jgi:hypothetical protein
VFESSHAGAAIQVPRRGAAGAIGLAALEPTFGGNHNFNLVLFNGGTMFIDKGALRRTDLA